MVQQPEKLNDKELPPYEAFRNKVWNCKPLEKEYQDYENVMSFRLTTEFSVVKMSLPKKPPSRAENYYYLQKVWEYDKMQSFKDFLRW